MNYKEIRELEKKINTEMKSNVLLSLSTPSRSIKNGLSSGSLRLNEALSGNPLFGYSWGRIVEIFGVEQSGKSTLALHAIKECQKLNKLAGYVDAEHALDPEYAEKLGVDLKALSLCQPDYGEQALAVAEKMIDNSYKLVVIDSVAALIPRAELEGELGAAHIGQQARMMGQAMRRFVGRVKKANAIVIFINQIRMKIGVMFGNPETVSGGLALKYFASYRLDMRSPRGGAKSEKAVGEEAVEYGIEANIKIVKNKCYPPFRRATVFIRYGQGIDSIMDCVSYLESKDLFGEKGRLKINGKAYTANVLQKEMEKDKEFKNLVYEKVKDYILKGEEKNDKENNKTDSKIKNKKMG